MPPRGTSSATAARARPQGSTAPAPPPAGPRGPRRSGGFLLQLVLVGGVQDDRLGLLEDDLLGDHDLTRGLLRRNVVHHVEHRALEDRAEPARSGLPANRLG